MRSAVSRDNASPCNALVEVQTWLALGHCSHWLQKLVCFHNSDLCNYARFPAVCLLAAQQHQMWELIALDQCNTLAMNSLLGMRNARHVGKKVPCVCFNVRSDSLLQWQAGFSTKRSVDVLGCHELLRISVWKWQSFHYLIGNNHPRGSAIITPALALHNACILFMPYTSANQGHHHH